MKSVISTLHILKFWFHWNRKRTNILVHCINVAAKGSDPSNFRQYSYRWFKPRVFWFIVLRTVYEKKMTCNFHRKKAQSVRGSDCCLGHQAAAQQSVDHICLWQYDCNTCQRKTFYRENVDLPFIRSRKSFSACKSGQNRLYYQNIFWDFSIHRKFLGNRNLQILFCKATYWSQGSKSPSKPTLSGLLKILILSVALFIVHNTISFPWEKNAVIFFKVETKLSQTTFLSLH